MSQFLEGTPMEYNRQRVVEVTELIFPRQKPGLKKVSPYLRKSDKSRNGYTLYIQYFLE